MVQQKIVNATAKKISVVQYNLSTTVPILFTIYFVILLILNSHFISPQLFFKMNQNKLKIILREVLAGLYL